MKTIRNVPFPDALIERDSAGGQRLYAQQDANWNVTALMDATTGNVAERFVYDPYGKPTDAGGQNVGALNPNWTTKTGGDSYGWVYLHQGGRYEASTGLYNFRHRDYSPTLGRWLQEDPLRFAAGNPNFYAYLHQSPAANIDPSGLLEWDVSGPLSFRTKVQDESVGVDGWVSVHTPADITPRDKRYESEKNCIYISYIGKGAEKISFIQFVHVNLKVERTTGTRLERLPILGPRGAMQTTIESDDIPTAQLDGNPGTTNPDYREGGAIGGLGGDFPDNAWIYDAPATGKRVSILWAEGIRGGVPFSRQADVVAIYLYEWFTTYVVACKKPLLKLKWLSYASWNRNQGAPARDSVQTEISWVGAETPDQFINGDEFKNHQRLAGGDFLGGR